MKICKYIRWALPINKEQLITNNVYSQNSTLCDFCSEALDFIEHRYLFCRVTQNFWHNVQQWIIQEYNLDHDICSSHLIITNLCIQQPLLELIVLNAKYYLYSCFLQKTIPNISQFKNLMYNIEEIERNLAMDKNLIHLHNLKWKKRVTH